MDNRIVSMWPDDQLFLDKTDCESIAGRVLPEFRSCCERLGLPAALADYLQPLYLPFGAWLARRKRSQQGPLVVGICGGQGSGKSTVTALLVLVLKSGFGLRTASLSIDDIYKTKADRQLLSNELHPLFVTRGVPMTHDVALGIETINRLRQQSDSGSTAIPSFDKSRDDRRSEDQWPVFSGVADIIILEGWFVGARAQDASLLGAPINILERDHDPDGVWRRSVNAALANEYQKLFSLLDILVLLQVENMAKVFQWRRLQERKLAQQIKQSGEAMDDMKVMSKQEVDRFVMHYERITRHILDEMPARADIVFDIDDSHSPAAVLINHPIE